MDVPIRTIAASGLLALVTVLIRIEHRLTKIETTLDHELQSLKQRITKIETTLDHELPLLKHELTNLKHGFTEIETTLKQGDSQLASYQPLAEAAHARKPAVVVVGSVAGVFLHIRMRQDEEIGRLAWIPSPHLPHPRASARRRPLRLLRHRRETWPCAHPAGIALILCSPPAA